MMYDQVARRRGRDTTAKRIFGAVYEQDRWNGGSGPGSAPENTEVYRQWLQAWLDSHPGLDVVDVGCGDWQIGELMDWSGCASYTGVDVVDAVQQRNQARDTPANVEFVTLDAMRDDLPPGDVLIVKDVFQHWPNDAVSRFLDRWLGEFLYVIVTNDVKAKSNRTPVNAQVKLGGWRPVDLEARPFEVDVSEILEYPVLDEWVKRAVII